MDENNDMNFNYYSDSDDDGGDEEHKRLLAAISKLDKRKRLAPSERKEPSLQVSEFHLSKGDDSLESTVHLRHLAKSLNADTNQVDIIRKLRTTENKAKTLPKPLEKPTAEKIKREVSFKNVQKQLNKWDPVVIKNRVSDDLVFPLKSESLHQIDTKEFLDPNREAISELQRQMAAVLNSSPSVQKEREADEEFALSLEEMIQRRQELARLKAQESHRHVKAHRQSKIKSKKFHRYARRERIRQQLKEFEELQAKDPEAALERLAEIEKQRVLERASLRHRSTGKWAQNHAVRAKYDKESRQVLSEQLRINKDLTQKVQVESESSDEEAADDIPATTDNPWMSQTKTEEDIDAFLSGYRKYYAEKANKPNENGEEKICNGGTLEDAPENEKIVLEPKAKALIESAVESYSEITNTAQKISKPQEQKTLSSSPTKNKKKRKTKPAKEEKLTAVSSGGNWTVTSLETTDEHSLHHMFEDLNEKMTLKAQKKIAGIKGDLKADKRKVAPSKRKSKYVDPSALLELKKQKLQVDIDEKLDEGFGDEAVDKEYNDLAAKIKLAASKTTESKNSTTAPELDPNKFMKTGHVKLKTALPEEVTGGDEGLDDSDAELGEDEKHLTISEAFADDDVVADFSKEKQDAIDKDKPEDINLSLPGWGGWAGHNMKPNKRKQKRFIVKMPEAPPRRDENKGNLIINENQDAAVRAHQVADLPFPFTSVKDYEASVRAPIGNTFIPESAHRQLIKPSIRTKMGAVINPIGKEVLVDESQKKKKKK